MTDPPPSTDEHGCGLPVMATIPSDRAFDYEAMYEALMYYRSDPNAGEVKFDEVKEQFEKLSYQDGENLSGMTGDLTDTIKAMNDVWVLQYTDSETGYELAILLQDFDPATGMLPEDLDFSGVSYSYELKDKLYLLKQRYAALKLTIYIPDFIPDCEIITEIQLNAYFSLVKVPLVLVACVTIECEAVIIVPVVCYSQTWFWIGEPVCEWILITRIYVKLLFIQITYWVRYWWITAFPVWAVQPLPDCPDPDMGAIAPYEGYSSSFLNMAMDNFMSSVSGDMASELYVDQFRFVYNEELQGQSNTALSTMEGAVTDTVNGFKDKWVLTYQESPEDEETSILLEDFDPNASELPNEIQLGDLSGFPSYNERYLRQFQYRYMEMRQTVSLQTVIPTNCGTAIYSIRLNSRFTLRRLPFFLMACWEISFSEYLIIPVPCYEIYIICGIRVVIPVIKVMIIRREFWFGIWVFIPLPACPWPPAPNPGSVIAFGSPTGLSHLDTCTYRCLPGFQKCKGLNTLVCWKGQWRPQQFQLQCAPICPVAPAAGFGAVRVGCIKVPIFGLWLKEVCFYQCLNGWNRWKGSYVRGCRKGIWTGSPLVCLPPWIIWPFRTPCDCKDVLDIDPAAPSGIYMVYPRDRLGGFLVYCDMETDGGGWTVIQRREDGSVNFYLGWDDYKYGFPDDMTGEFWLGNDKINRLTTQKDYALRVDLQASDNTTAFALYNSFSVADEDDKYRLSIGGYSVTSTAGDAMTAQEVGHNLNNLQFSTYDSDNDIWDGNCAERFIGAWWYCACHDSNLNGDYDNDMYGKGVMWKQFKGLHESLPFSEMKIRPTG
ncbi:uncharacterized protein LOC118421508 [Branchiostoma floridae]|uniref:Uncharacterized protein LOC118421508 n=1 Tax=Branchiostoma floridae TaxID=7739 RepID=A0A9J7LLG5_BRAFL|nr:uncharacterized protein LOC118421508 [Branchiostoma floridae]